MVHEPQKTARWRKRRIIVNNDGDDIWEARSQADIDLGLLERKTELIDDFLRARTSPLVGSQVDTIFYATCTAGLSFSHNTSVGYFVNQGPPKELVELYGKDNLQIQIDFCRKNGFEIFWSLRMNDVHDSYPIGSRRWTSEGWHFATFKKDHPEFLMGKPDDWEKYPGSSPRKFWSSLDFSHPEVRNHIFRIIQEVCQRYDVDGIELDFLRHPPFFPPTWDVLPVEQKHLDMMTDLIQRLKNMTREVSSKRGRPLLIATCIPFTVDLSRFIGLDVERWLKENLIDILIPGRYGGYLDKWPSMTMPFKGMVELGHKYDVPVYPCISDGFWAPWAWLDLNLDIPWRGYESWIEAKRKGKIKSAMTPIRSWSGAVEAIRGAAMNIWNSGANGIYAFNFFNPNHQMWWEIGDPATLAEMDKIYGVNYPDSETALELKEGEAVSVDFPVGEDLRSETLSGLKLRLHMTQLTSKDDIAVEINGTTLNDLKPTGTLQQVPGEHWLECHLNPAQVNRGDNKIELFLTKRDESASTPIILDGLQLLVRHKK